MLLTCSALQARVASTHALFAGPSALQHCALTLCCFLDHPKGELKVKMSTRSVDVAVVGAGISGLVAATTLQGKHTVAVLEARGRSGGRLLSPRGIDLGASWSWPPGDRRVAALASRLQLRAVAQRLRGEAFAHDPRKGAVSLGNVGDRMAPCGPSAVRFEHGYASFTAALSAKLPHEDLMLGCQVTELSAAESGGIKVVYKRAGSSAFQTLRAKRVIVALPPAVHALSISYNPPLPASQSKFMASTSTWCGNWCKAVAFFRTPFWEKAGASGVSQTAGPFSIWWEGGAGSTHAEQPALVGLGVGEEVCKALAPYSETGVDDESAPQVRDMVKAALGSIYGKDVIEAELKSVRHKCWGTDPLTYAASGVNREYGHPLLSRPTEWGVHFAGTETEDEYGHVEGAVAAGQRAAEEVAQSLASCSTQEHAR